MYEYGYTHEINRDIYHEPVESLELSIKSLESRIRNVNFNEDKVAIDTMIALEDLFHDLGLTQYLINKGFYENKSEKTEDQLLADIESMQERAINLASNIHEKFGTEIPVFDMTYKIREYLSPEELASLEE